MVNALVLQENLLAALKKVKYTKRNLFPILDYVRIYSGDDGYIHLETCDLETAKVAKVSARIYDGKIDTCVPMRKVVKIDEPTCVDDYGQTHYRDITITCYPLLEWVNACDKNSVIGIEQTDNTLILTNGKSKAVFYCLSSGEFPPLTSMKILES